MIEIVLSASTKERALELRDALHNALAGCKAYVDNDILLSSGTVNSPYDGSMICLDRNGGIHQHRISLVLNLDSYNKDESSDVERTIIVNLDTAIVEKQSAKLGFLTSASTGEPLKD